MLSLVTAPAALPVDAQMVWSHIGPPIPVDDGASPSDLAPENAAYIDELIAAAVARIDGPTGLLNRALISQRWRLTLDHCFPARVEIPLARCKAVQSVAYVDRTGTTRTLAEEAYRVVGLNADSCSIAPAWGLSWPSTRDDLEVITVEFTSGFGDTAEDVPPTLRHALLEMVSTAYEYRESVIAGAAFSELPTSATRVFADWTVFKL